MKKYENNWIDSLNELENKKVLLMLSGGKDSSSCLHMLKKANIDVEAIHFTHNWGYKTSTLEAKKLCDNLGVILHEINFSEQFLNAIKGFDGGRPCLLCKPEMYKLVIEKIKEGNFGCVCIGDNADDRMTIVRLLEHIENTDEKSLFCNSYFGSERGIKLPDNIKVLRPLLELNSGEVENYLKENDIVINKNFSTGDKYFEYAREGCPVQFHDPGYKINEDTISDLQKYNILLSQYAKKKNIRASIHLPTTFIVTIPEGYEVDALKFLEENGLEINWDVNKIHTDSSLERTVIINNLAINFLDNDVFTKLNTRFLERLEFKIINYEIHDKYINSLSGEGFIFEFKYIKNLNKISINYFIDTNICNIKSNLDELIQNLIKEIYRSRNYKILR